MKVALALYAVLAAASCREPPAPPPLTEFIDAGGAYRALATCASACGRLAAFGCPEGRPTPAGASCTEVCSAARQSRVDLPIACVTRATDIAGVRACGVRCAADFLPR